METTSYEPPPLGYALTTCRYESTTTVSSVTTAAAIHGVKCRYVSHRG
nr:hypothetical protein [Streptomyces albicerus]